MCAFDHSLSTVLRIGRSLGPSEVDEVELSELDSLLEALVMVALTNRDR